MISSLEDLKEAVLVCNSSGDFRFEDIDGNFMLNFLFYHFESIEPRIIRDYFDYEAYGRNIIIGGTYKILEREFYLLYYIEIAPLGAIFYKKI